MRGFREWGQAVPEGEKKEDFGRMPGFAKFLRGGLKDVNKVDLLEIIRKLKLRKRILRYKI